MGTNYYLHRNMCRHCGRSDEPLHIGKSSVGWTFALHVIPDLGINDLPDWQREWQDGTIKDEYGDVIDTNEMLRVITEREWSNRDWDTRSWFWYRDEADFHARNYSERGPNGLLRRRISRWCIGHGAGTWDLCPGEFS